MCRSPCGPMSGAPGHLGDPPVHQRAHRALVDPPAAGAEEQRRTGPLDPQRGPAVRRASGRAPGRPDARTARSAPCAPCRRPGPRCGRGRRRRGRGRPARPPGCRWRRAARASPRRACRPGCRRRRAAAAVRTRSAASSARSTGGSGRWALGDPRLAPASLAARPVRSSQAVKTRAAVARRASVVRERPTVCCLASQLRRVRRSSRVTSTWPSRAACSSSPATSPR